MQELHYDKQAQILVANPNETLRTKVSSKNTQDEIFIDSSIRWFYLHQKKVAVCREYLALLSKRLAIRTYYLITKSRNQSAELDFVTKFLCGTQLVAGYWALPFDYIEVC